MTVYNMIVHDMIHIYECEKPMLRMARAPVLEMEKLATADLEMH
jgi:hypothetical protein